LTATLQTIADMVNVSRSTVSRVLNNKWKKHGICQATADKITSRAKELHYLKNEAARSLRDKKTFTIGVIVRDITNLFYSQLVKFVESALYTKGYTIIICNTSYDLDRENALSLASISISDHYVKHGNYTFEHGYEAVTQLLRSDDVPTAFFAANNRIMLGAYKGIIDGGLQIPDDVSIVGFDDFKTATRLPSPLTVIRQPIPDMALHAVDLLLSRIENANHIPYMTSMLKTEFVLRNSTKSLN